MNLHTGYPSQDRPWLQYFSQEAKDAPVPHCTMYDHLYQCNQDHPGDIALNYFDRRFTYGQLFADIHHAARSFAALGVRAGDMVTLVSVSTPETICAIYALNRMGAICNMVDPRTSPQGMRGYIQEVRSRLVIAIEAALPKVEEAVRDTAVETVIVLSPYRSLPTLKRLLVGLAKGKRAPLPAGFLEWDTFWKGEAQPHYPPYAPDTCAVIVHTGGTTGTPKGVMLSNDNITISAHDCVYNTPDMQRRQTWLNIMPPFIAYGIGPGLHLPLICGMEVILIPQFDPNEYHKLLNHHHPNHMLGTPTHYETLLNSPQMRGKDLSYIIAPGVGGDTIKHDLEEKINSWLGEHNCGYTIQKGYGMSEVAAGVTFTVHPDCNAMGSVGVPILHSVISVFHPETGAELTYGQQGEICIAGPNVMLGYYENQAETDQVIRTHPDGLRWVHSGDMGYMREDGTIFILDRMKRIIIRYDGFKVFPSQIEAVVAGHPAVTACCAVGRDDPDHRQGRLPVVFAALSPDSGVAQTREELAARCQGMLPEYAQPVDFLFLERLPLTPIGKIDYRQLEKLARIR